MTKAGIFSDSNAQNLFCTHEPTHLILVSEAHGLQLLRPLLGERLRGEGEVVGLGESAQVEVVLCVNRRGDVDVELQHLQELPFQLVPERVAFMLKIDDKIS